MINLKFKFNYVYNTWFCCQLVFRVQFGITNVPYVTTLFYWIKISAAPIDKTIIIFSCKIINYKDTAIRYSLEKTEKQKDVR